MVRQIEVTIPAPMSSVRLDVPAHLAEELDVASRAVARLDAEHGSTLTALAGLLLRTESVASSKIEQISASVDDYARALHGSNANPSAVSMVAATQAMTTLFDAASATRRVQLGEVLVAHQRLMDVDPAERGYAGRVRDVQNWIGGSDYSPRHALFVPPPPEALAECLDDLFAFADRTDVPPLLQATIAHAQFETVHPFTDGNGRIGRALVNAIFRARGMTTHVVVPVASALVARRDAYFAALGAFRRGDLEPLLLAFATGARLAAEESIVTASRLRAVPEQWLAQLGRTRAGSAPVVITERLLEHPIVAAADLEASLGLRTSVVYASLERLVSAGIIRPLTDRRRNQVWGAVDVLDELEDLNRRIQIRAVSQMKTT